MPRNPGAEIVSSSQPPSPDLAGDDAPKTYWEPSHSFLRFAVNLLLVGAAASLMATWIFAPEQTVRIAAQALLLATSLVAWVSLTLGRHHLTIYILAMGSWATTAAISTFTGGVKAPVIMAFPVVVIFVGWLIIDISVKHDNF